MRTDKKLWRNRKAKKELARRLQSENPGLEVVHAHAAGIDVGNSAHLRGSATGLRPGTGAPVRVLHSSSPSISRLVRELRSADGGVAVDRSVVDPAVRHFGRTRVGGLSGQRLAHQESSGTQKRCAGGPGTPVSLTFLGQLYGKAKLLAFARAHQEATGFHLRHPKLSA
jgi:hypothetical protein